MTWAIAIILAAVGLIFLQAWWFRRHEQKTATVDPNFHISTDPATNMQIDRDYQDRRIKEKMAEAEERDRRSLIDPWYSQK